MVDCGQEDIGPFEDAQTAAPGNKEMLWSLSHQPTPACAPRSGCNDGTSPADNGKRCDFLLIEDQELLPLAAKVIHNDGVADGIQ